MQPRKRCLRISFVCLGSTNDTTAPCRGTTTSLASRTRYGLSRDFNLTWDEQMEVLAPHLPAPEEYQIWTLTEEFMDAILGALLRKRVPPESLIVAPSQPEPIARPPSGSPTLTWPSAPYSKPSRAKFEKYTSSDQDFCKEKLRPSEIPSGLSRLKVTYGSVPRRPRAWGPRSR